MLLKIIDRPAAVVAGTEGGEGRKDAKDTIEVSLDAGPDSRSFITDEGATQPSTELLETLDGYFTEYLEIGAERPEDHGAVAKLAEIGRRLGDLLGGDTHLSKIVEVIEKRGAEHLGVRVESPRTAFLTAPWELLMLPKGGQERPASGIGQPLSAISGDFVRRFTGEGVSEDDSELVFDLEVTAPVPDAVAALNAQLGAPAPSKEKTRHAPLRILHIVPRGTLDACSAVHCATQSLESEGAIDYEIFATGNWAELRKRLEDRKRPVQIVHYDGPIALDANGEPSVWLDRSDDSSERVVVEDFAKVLARGKIAALCVDARGYFEDTPPMDAGIRACDGLHAIARAAHRAGLGNVIGLSHVTDPWTSGRCFQLIYNQLTEGLPLARAVAEARRTLHAQPETVHAWPLVVHYGGRHVTFFEAAQTRANLRESQTLVRARQRLLGFIGTQLPPMLSASGDGQVVALIGEIQRSRRALSLVGEPGSGKTLLAHRLAFYLAAQQAIDFGFYFDFDADFYSVDNILEMIAPVLGFTVDQRAETKAALRKLHCCFVLDEFASETSADTEANSSTAARQALIDFVGELLADGHIVLCANPTSLAELPSTFVELPLLPLTSAERKHLGAARLRAHDLAGKGREEGFAALLDATRGHPFLVERALPLLDRLTAGELARALEMGLDRGERSTVEAFYDWQWSEMPREWQGLLLLSAEVDGLLLEMLMVAFDQKEPFEPAKKLLARVGNEVASFADGLKLWERSGFLERLPHGRTVDPRCRHFLARKRRDWPLNGNDEIRLPFSQTLCEGIRLLAHHLGNQRNQAGQANQANPALTHYLLANRRRWIAHFERLWFAQDYRGFLRAKNAFDHLLHQAQLGAESAAWSLDLLRRTPEPRIDGHPEAHLAWLALGTSALTTNGAENEEALKKGAAIWQRWLEAQPATVDKREALVLQRVAMFLDLFHRNAKNWKAAIEVNEKARPVYVHFEVWPMAIQSLKALARYHVELGETEKALGFEDEVLHQIPYADAPPGFQAQQWFDVAVARIARGALAQARTALDHLSAMDDAKRLGDALDGLNAELHFQQGNYAESIRYHCKLWTRAVRTEQQPVIERLQNRFREIERKLGPSEFNRHLDAELTDDVARPLSAAR